jgi:excisionase family DNA binding protein
MRSVSITKAAEEMDVSEAHVRRLLSRGDLRGHRVGRAVRVYAESIEDFQRRNEIGPDRVEPEPRASTRTGARKSASLQAAEVTLNRLLYT